MRPDDDHRHHAARTAVDGARHGAAGHRGHYDAGRTLYDAHGATAHRRPAAPPTPPGHRVTAAVDVESLTVAGAFVLGAVAATVAVLRAVRHLAGMFVDVERRRRG